MLSTNTYYLLLLGYTGCDCEYPRGLLITLVNPCSYPCPLMNFA